ncbi:MAG: hypothetical protein HY255_08950, partial [Betaproteobacteria bacterium]|nr:hypothetical protein [Betaproteobacteria bacterium]
MNGFGSPYLSMTDGQFPLNLEGGDDSEDPLYQRGVRAVLNAVMNRPGGPEGFGTSAQRFTPAELAAPSAFPGSDARPISSVAGNRQSAPIRSAGAGSSVTGPIGSPTRNVNSAADFSREDRRFAQQETKAAASSGSGPAAPASPTPAEPRTTFHAPFANGEFDIGGEVPDTGEPGRDPVGEFVAHVPAGVVQQIVENPGEALRNAGCGVAGIAKGIPNAVSEGVAQAGLGYRYLLAAMGEKRGIYPPGTLDNLIASNEG